MRLQSKTKMTLLLLFLGTGIAVVAVDEHNFEIFEDHQPKTVLIVPENSPIELVKTIDFFNGELKKTGITLPVAKTIPAIGNCIEFVIRKSSFKERGRYSIMFHDQRTMQITGSTVSVRWALNYLLDKAGIRYPYPGVDGAYYPQLAKFSIPREPVNYDASYIEDFLLKIKSGNLA